MLKAPNKRPQASEVHAEVLPDGTLVIRFGGHVDVALVQRACKVAFAAVEGSPARAVVFDTLAVTGFDAAIRDAGGELLNGLRARGIPGGACAVSVPSVRMIGSAIAFAARLPIEFVSTRDEALRIARARG